EAVLGVVLAAKGYPEAYEKGAEIAGLETLKESTLVFHAGTKREDVLRTNGGRVLLVAAKGATLQEAQREVYDEIAKVRCDQLFYRRDIGDKAIKRAFSEQKQT
ncbi:MAG: phosphoribosylamine--glycine ligase, partial [Anoxybacillus sp.]